jgi:hypothetical protein
LSQETFFADELEDFFPEDLPEDLPEDPADEETEDDVSSGLAGELSPPQAINMAAATNRYRNFFIFHP